MISRGCAVKTSIGFSVLSSNIKIPVTDVFYFGVMSITIYKFKNVIIS
jgi:hypothetical protein